MSTLSNLTSLGVKESEIRSGEVVELDVLTLKDAKKNKWNEVTNAEDSSDVIAAYAGDLAATIQAKDELADENDELAEQVNHLSEENGQLTQALQTGGHVDQRIDDFTALMDEMEANLNELMQRKQMDDAELNDLRETVGKIREENDRLNSELTAVTADRDSLQSLLDQNGADKDARIQELEQQLAEREEALAVKEAELADYDVAWDDLERDVNQVMGNLYQRAKDAGVQFEDAE